MDAPRLIAALERFGRALPRLVDSIPQVDLRWKPSDGAWSILEALCHLADEEVEDFRRRLELILRDPALDWPPIDPPRAAVERRYNEQDPHETLTRFTRERGASIAWLRGLREPDWTTTKTHPKFGSMTAGELLVSWAAHDALHLRQIARRLHQLVQRDGEGFSAAYAGDW